tara:strand:+ start:4308 stop:5000 length:693 start_codon:yes stop_codon:yes gene_type:complete
MPRAIGIYEFKEKILAKSGGISASNLYQFSIAATDGLKGYLSNNLNTGTNPADMINYELNMLCNEIQVPGVTFSSNDLKQVHKGITQKMANYKVFNELDVSFYCDADSTPLKFFRAWQDFTIGGLEKPVNAYTQGNQLVKSNHQVYSQRYYDDYTSDIIIHKLEKYGTIRDANVSGGPAAEEMEDYQANFHVRLANAYPYTVSSVPYSAAAAELVKVTIGFYYEYSHLVN